MSDKKISALIGATTPLAGTEVLPIVQSGSTVNVTVANLTAGRAVAMAGGSFTDNIAQGTAAKGIDFTANTPAAGMTSQLLNWYEEGTWTPNQGAGLVVVGTFSSAGSYVRVGRVVTLNFKLLSTGSITATGVVALTSNLPFPAKADSIGAFGTGTNDTAAVTFNFQLSGAAAYLEGSNIAATTAIYASVTYMAA